MTEEEYFKYKKRVENWLMKATDAQLFQEQLRRFNERVRGLLNRIKSRLRAIRKA